jgi:hypothetical protein
MAKSLDHDAPLKLRIRRILYTQGYWSSLEVDLSEYNVVDKFNVKRVSLTDLDVLGIRYDSMFSQTKVVADCKSGRNFSEVERLFWLNGVKEYFQANEAYFVHPRIQKHAKIIANKLSLRTLDEAALSHLEKTLRIENQLLPIVDLKIYQEISHLWGIKVLKGDKLSLEQLKIKEVFNYLSYNYWYTEQYRNVFSIIDRFRKVAHLLSPSDPSHQLLCYIGAERFTHCLMEAARYIVSYGVEDIAQAARIYFYGGVLSLRERERFFQLLKQTTGSREELQPFYWPEILELLWRIIKNSIDSIDILRHLFAIHLFCAYLKQPDLSQAGLPKNNTATIVLAKDCAFAFAKISGFSPEMFAALEPL